MSLFLEKRNSCRKGNEQIGLTRHQKIQTLNGRGSPNGDSRRSRSPNGHHFREASPCRKGVPVVQQIVESS